MYSTGVIFKRTLYDNRRSLFWWSFGIGLMGLYVVVAYPMIEGFEELADMMENPVFQVLLGDVGELDWTSPEGFMGIEFFSWIPLVLAVYGVLFGINITSGEEDRGTIDILLSTPTPRWQVIVEKFLAYIVGVALILGITTIVMLVGIAITPEMEGSQSALYRGMLNIMPPMIFIGTLSLLLSTLFRSPGRAGGVTAGIMIASYFTNSLADMTNNAVMRAIQYLSFYKYFDPMSVASDGINPADFSFLLLAAAILFALSIYFFERRDLYV